MSKNYQKEIIQEAIRWQNSNKETRHITENRFSNLAAVFSNMDLPTVDDLTELLLKEAVKIVNSRNLKEARKHAKKGV